MLNFFVKLFSSLNSNSNPGEIAHGIAIGVILGVMPKDNIFWYILAVFFLFIRVNKGALMLSTALFALLAPTFDYIFDTVGFYVLTIPQLQGFYVSLINTPFVGFTKFNNTIVMGSLACGLIVYIPVYWLSRLIVFLWRNKLAPIVQKTKVVKFLKQLPIVQKISDMSDLIESVKK